MASLVYALACRRMLLDKGSNLPSFIDVIERIKLAGPKVDDLAKVKMLDAIQHISVWTCNEDETIDIKLRGVGPSGKEFMKESSITAELKADKHIRMTTNIRNMSIEQGPGVYKLQTFYRAAPQNKWKKVSDYGIDIEVEFTENIVQNV